MDFLSATVPASMSLARVTGRQLKMFLRASRSFVSDKIHYRTVFKAVEVASVARLKSITFGERDDEPL